MRGRRAITRVSEGWFRVPGYPLTAERTLFLDRGGVRSRRAITRVSEGWLCAPGFPQRRNFSLALWVPLAAERPLYSELKNTLRGLDPRTRFTLNCKGSGVGDPALCASPMLAQLSEKNNNSSQRAGLHLAVWSERPCFTL